MDTLKLQGMDHYTAIRWLVHWPLMVALLAVPNVTAHPSTAIVPTSYYLMSIDSSILFIMIRQTHITQCNMAAWHYNNMCPLKGSAEWQNIVAGYWMVGTKIPSALKRASHSTVLDSESMSWHDERPTYRPQLPSRRRLSRCWWPTWAVWGCR